MSGLKEKNYLESTVCVGPFQCNCKLLVCTETGVGAVVDPGDEAPRILAEIQNLSKSKKDLNIKYLIHTHGHLDHIAATGDLLKSLSQSQAEPPIVCLHPGDLAIYEALPLQAEMFGLKYSKAPTPTSFLEDGQTIELGRLKIECRHTPGHSPGSVSLYLGDVLLSGDTLFQGSVGRTDLWGGDWDTLDASIRQRLFTLDDDVRVCPGHGPDTTIGIEKRTNPFFI